MLKRSTPWVLALALGSTQTMCSGGNGGTIGGDPGDGGDATTNPADDGTITFDSTGGGDSTDAFDVQPAALQTLKVGLGASTPTVSYTATLGGVPTGAVWSVDRPELGTMPTTPTATAAFSPTGKLGGVATITASLAGKKVTRQVFVQLSGTQNGANPSNPSEATQIPKAVGDLIAGGGVGGVGGEGLGGAVAPGPSLTALGAPTSTGTDVALKLLYPYDRTIWPLGMRAPLLMWSWKTNDADAISMSLTTASGSFSWTGTFARPAILAGNPFIRHPIPQDVWDIATRTASGLTPAGKHDTLTLSLTIAKGALAYGPISETWKVAPARLTGTVYYNSYGTQYVKNWTSKDSAGHALGAAILGIRSGDTAPKLVVGQNSPVDGSGNPSDDSGCRVCHVVASRGKWLVTQSEQGTPGDGRSFLYDLAAADVPSSGVALAQEGVFAWAGLTGDAKYALSNAINPSSSNPGILGSSSGSATSSFFNFSASPTAATATGLSAGLAAGYPSYSPDDKRIAWVDVTGSTNDVHGAIFAASFSTATLAFGPATKVLAPASGQRLGYPVFFPDNSGLVFETQLRSSQRDTVVVTRNGARSELWWSKLGASPTSVPLLALNGHLASGASYLPILGNNHGIAGAHDPRSSYDETGLDDTTLNYEPTVLPVVSGGYAWVVFTSRRAYGNQLTAVPWQSWPPDYDTQDLGQATVKKLWVAAIDLTAPAGADPSSPAFYLPAQEILAGNSRGFWVLDPCHADGAGCGAGDECCGGYCEPGGSGGPPVCSSVPPVKNCSAPEEKCTASSDCCDPADACINGFCAVPIH